MNEIKKPEKLDCDNCNDCLSTEEKTLCEIIDNRDDQWEAYNKSREVNVEEIEKMLGEECQVRWKERGYNIVCGHPLPCPKHQKIETWRHEIAKRIHQRIYGGENE